AKLLVSSPNQLTPVMRTSLPLASTIWPPLVRNGDTADILGGACCDCAKAGGAAAPTVRPTVAMSMSSFIRRLFVSAAGHIMVIWVRILPGFRERLKVLKRFERCPSCACFEERWLLSLAGARSPAPLDGEDVRSVLARAPGWGSLVANGVVQLDQLQAGGYLEPLGQAA